MKKKKKPPQLDRVFSSSQITEAIRTHRMLTLSISLPVDCNLRCTYCWILDLGIKKTQAKEKDLTFNELCDVILQAKKIGVETVSIVGKGEPLMYKKIRRLINFIDAQNMTTVIYTNGIFITKALAGFLYERKVKMVAKLNSLNPEIQEGLTGQGSWDKIQKGLAILMKQGFNKVNPTRLAIHSVIVKANYNSLAGIWTFCRDNNIIPYLHTFIPSEARHDKNLFVSKQKLQKLYNELSKIDMEKYGYAWDKNTTYPIPGQGCCVVKAGCAVGSTGKVKMCGYVNNSLADIRKQKLSEIIKLPAIEKIRRFKYTKSKKNPHFYGCRAIAFNLRGDRFAADPFSWIFSIPTPCLA